MDPPESHEPSGEEIAKLLKESSKRYYSKLSTFLNKEYFYISERRFGNESFYVLEPKGPYQCFPIGWAIVLPKTIKEFAQNGIPIDVKPFEVIDENNIYIDVDRVGIMVFLPGYRPLIF